MKTVIEKDSKLHIKFMYKDKKKFYDILEKVKSLPGREYKDKTWTAPKNEFVVQKLASWGFDTAHIALEKKVYKKLKLYKSTKRTPRQYQKIGVQAIHNFNGRALLADDMGLGKTSQAIIYMLSEPTIKNTLIVVPASLKINWKKEIHAWADDIPSIHIVTGTKDNITLSNVVIINYDILQHYEKVLCEHTFDLLVTDECFVENTLIHTRQGLFSIGDIVNNCLSVEILSFNLHTNAYEYKPIKRYIKKRLTSQCIKIKLKTGQVITCTEKHKIWTKEKGYVEARNLTGKETLRVLWRGATHNKIQKESLLQSKLFRKVENDITRKKRLVPTHNNRTAFKKYKVSTSKKSKSGKTIFPTNVYKQSYGECRNNRKDEKYKNKKWNLLRREWDSRREWQIHRTATKTIRKTSSKCLAIRTFCKNKKSNASSTYNVQNRYRQSSTEIRNRNRWKRSQHQKTKIIGSKEGTVSKFVRMENIKVLKSTDINEHRRSHERDIYVYDLEIKNNHNYFANDILVSNCHRIKNEKTIRFKTLNKIQKGIPKYISITGTPIESRPIELYNTLHMLYPDVYKNKYQFGYRYCGLTNNGFGLNWNGSSNVMELNALLKNTLMIRRKKSDVLKELPEKNRIVVPFEISNRKEYLAVEEEDLIPIALLERYKQVAAEGKMKSVISWIDDFLESGNKLVIMATHHKIIDMLHEKYKNIAVTFDGRCNIKHKDNAIEKFMNDDKCTLFLGNIKAAGVGITLTVARTLAFVELGWTPGEHDQAEDRIHRIGQKNQVDIYYLVAADTVEEEIVELLDEKRKVVTAVHDGEEVESKTLLGELMKRYKKET